MSNIPFITSTGSFERAAIMRAAHASAKKYLNEIYGGNYRAAFKASLECAWATAGGYKAIYQARTGQVREYTCVARDVMLPA
jgi:hypothetical protein